MNPHGNELRSSGEVATDSQCLSWLQGLLGSLSWINTPVSQSIHWYFLPFRNNDGIYHW